MNKIHPLPQEIIAKIAAGEVIERPAYAVKELLENSLDAGADSISIHIEESGLRKITVIDNGEGMSREDLLECFKPHTTSKISSETELSNIQTLGFRGEALSSIAVISKMNIKSKRQGDTAGVSVEIYAGKIEKISSTGMPAGTQITIENIFSPIPGRKKFLKSLFTEYNHILEVVTGVALAYPQVQFVLSHNGKQIFDLPKTNDTLERTKQLLGMDFYFNILPLTYEDSYIKISGFLSKPHLTTSSLRKHFFYVNNRKIKNRLFSWTIKNAYGTLLPSPSYPVCVLFFSLPYETVDVNVHPRKEEVRFVDNELISDAIHKAVKQTLAKHSLINKSDLDEDILKPNTKSYAGRILREKKLPWTLQDIDEISGKKHIVQLHNLYLLSQSKYGIQFVDQHAAHERILFEQLSEEFKKQKKETPTFGFQKPIVFNLSFVEGQVLSENIKLFNDLGFEIEHFKGSTFLLQTAPLLFQDRNCKQLILEMIDDLKDEKKPKEIDSITSRMIAYLACRGAVKAGDKLTQKQAKDLLEKLTKTRNNATCPHGRPVKVEIDLEKINKLFKRT